MNTEIQTSTPKPRLPVSSTASPSRVDSTTLLGGRAEVEIAHQGETYRLRRTRQGKLILTK